jgi:hypothetical protein
MPDLNTYFRYQFAELNLMSKTLYSISSTLLLVIFLSGCMGSMTRATAESDRDATGKFDGLWNVEVHKSPALQFLQNWQMSCSNLERTTKMLIVDGKITSLSGQNSSGSNTFVSQKGIFRYVQPLAEKAKASGTSDVSMSDGSIKIIFNGKLNDKTGKGFLTVGIAQFAYDGCKSKATFTKEN